jgi:Ca-activated chloride channel family protein
VPLGTFARGDEKSVLLRLRVNRADAGDRPIADVRLRYRDLVEETEGTCEGELLAVVTDDPREVSPLDPLVEARLARAETVAALATANSQFARGDVLSARRTLQENRSRIRTRASSSGSRASAKDKSRLDADFAGQIGALQRAESGFEEAERAAPAAPAQSREGRASVKSNADLFDDFGQ